MGKWGNKTPSPSGVYYDIQFKEVMTDNGAEFASKNNLVGHPFERMLIEETSVYQAVQTTSGS